MAGALQFENVFGQVFSDRVCFNLKKPWFGGSVQEDYALRHITTVRAEVSRNVALGVILGLVGLVCMSSGGAVVIVGLVLAGLAVLAIIGNPAVTIVTAGGEPRTSIGSFSQHQDATVFAAAVKEALFAEEPHRPPSPAMPENIPTSSANTRACPICAEDVKLAALKCRFCGADLQNS